MPHNTVETERYARPSAPRLLVPLKHHAYWRKTLSDSPIELETAPNPDAAVIWMHGLGADGSDFVPVVPELRLPKTLAVRFIFPHAPRIPVTWNGGYVMRAWYDIESVEEGSVTGDGAGHGKRHADAAGVRASCDTVRDLIARENTRGVPTDRIVLAGFSQGGAIAYTAGLTHPEKLAGVVALSTYLPVPSIITEASVAASRATPVFAAHGTQDGVVPYALGESARDTAERLGFSVDWRSYPIAHTVNLEELTDIGAWLAGRW